MKLKLNFKIIILFLLISFIIPIGIVNADGYFTDTSTIIDDTNELETEEISSGGEKEILERAKSSEQVDFRRLADLNVNIGKLWEFVRWIIGALSVFGTISAFFILTKSFLQIAWIPDHPMERRKCYKDILTSGVCTILFGGLSLIMTIFYKTFQNFITNSVMLSRDYKSAFALFLVEYKYLIAGACGVMSLTLMVFFIKDIIVLAGSGGNPNKRAQAVNGLLFSLVGIVGAGSVGLIVAIFTGLLV